ANPTILSLSSFNREINSNGNARTYKFTLNPYPDANALVVAPNTKDYYLEVAGKVAQGTGQRLFDYSWLYGPIVYKVKINVDGTEYKIKSNSNILTTTINANPNSTVTVCGYYGYDYVEVNSSELCKTDKMNELFLNVPNFIGETTSVLSTWINTNGLTASKFTTVEIEAEDASQINMIGKIVRIDPADKHNTTIEIANKDSLTFTPYVVKETQINLADFIGKTPSTLPTVCAKYSELCSLHSTSTATGTITKVFIGSTEYTSGTVNLSEIYSEGIKYYIGPITTP
ncbi:MAG: hypothetical protein ACYDEI_01690, partial [Erysipelotrichaceae bacterium]